MRNINVNSITNSKAFIESQRDGQDGVNLKRKVNIIMFGIKGNKI